MSPSTTGDEGNFYQVFGTLRTQLYTVMCTEVPPSWHTISLGPVVCIYHACIREPKSTSLQKNLKIFSSISKSITEFSEIFTELCMMYTSNLSHLSYVAKIFTQGVFPKTLCKTLQKCKTLFPGNIRKHNPFSIFGLNFPRSSSGFVRVLNKCIFESLHNCNFHELWGTRPHGNPRPLELLHV